MLDCVIVPALAEALPVARVHGSLAEHVPHGHLVGPGVAGGHDGAEVVVRHLQNALGVLDGLAQPGLAELRAVRTTQGIGAKRGKVVAGALLAGAGGELGVAGLDGGLRGALDVALHRGLHSAAAHSEIGVDRLLEADL